MADPFVGASAQEATKRVIDQILQPINYIWEYKTNIEELHERVKQLEEKEETIRKQVDLATNNAEDIRQDVKGWQERVAKLKGQTHELLERAKEDKWSCFNCRCPKLHSRYTLSKEALEMVKRIDPVICEGKFEMVGHRRPLGQMPLISSKEYVGFESRKKVRNDIIEALKDNSITIIGICGMAGVGKTTLVKEIAEQVKATRLFDEVTMVVISGNPVIPKIQQELAERLGLRLEEATDDSRAERLYTRWMNKDKKILIILDDVWRELDLRNLGILDEVMHNGLKIVLTSRFDQVCRKMRVQTFEVKVLSEEESHHLFMETVEISDAAIDMGKIAREVVSECGGLPLAIMTVAKALRKKGEYAWKDALEQLKQPSEGNIDGVSEEVYKSIKLSYDYLAEGSQKLLLLCSLFPEDFEIPVEYLVTYSKGLDLFKNLRSVAKVRDRVYALTDDLKSCYLLLKAEEEEDESHVRLHDVVRDCCLFITSSYNVGRYIVDHSGVKEFPRPDSGKPFTAISFTLGKSYELPSVLPFQQLQLLHLVFQRYEEELRVPKDLFQRVKELKVLKLRSFRGELPLSLQLLTNLRTLSLYDCSISGDISILGKLKGLEILCFYGSVLPYFPYEIGLLSDLKLLDLRFVEEKCVRFPLGVVSSLKRLEALYLGSYFEEIERENGVFSKIVSEIGLLQNLEAFQFRTNDDLCLEKILENLSVQNLSMFSICKVESLDNDGNEGFQLGKDLFLCNVNINSLLNPALGRLLEETNDLGLSCVHGLKNLVNELDKKGFVNLKRLKLERCNLNYLVDANESHNIGGAFINLEDLEIESTEMDELCHGDLHPGSFERLRSLKLNNVRSLMKLWGVIGSSCFHNLKSLKIERCGSITYLFPRSSLKCLQQLRKLSLVKCLRLERVTSPEEEEDEKGPRDHVTILPKLETLVILGLDNFKSFDPRTQDGILFKKVMLPRLNKLWIGYSNIRFIVDDPTPDLAFPMLRTLHVSDEVFEHVAASDRMRNLQSVKDLYLSDNDTIEIMFDFGGLNIQEAESLHFRLEELHLDWMISLKFLCRMLPKRTDLFMSLRELKVKFCHRLKYLLPPTVSKLFVSLETLTIWKCAKMEAMIGSEQIEVSEIEDEEGISREGDGEESLTKIEFPKLRRLHLEELDCFQTLCLGNVDLDLPSLIEFEILGCPEMTRFCGGKLNARRLRDVRIGSDVLTAKFFSSSWLKECQALNRCVTCFAGGRIPCIHGLT